MDSFQFKYQEAIKDQFKQMIKTKKFTSLSDMLTLCFDEIFKKVTLVAELSNWPLIDKVTFTNYFDVVRKEVQSNHVTKINDSNTLAKDSDTWLTPVKIEQIKWNYTNRYFEYLKDSGRAESVVSEIQKSSLKIVQKLSDPNSTKPFFIKGLVDGDVQSGKTGNFNAVINRAIDTGFKLIIVLSGTMDDLRTQTQTRIDSDVIGEGKGVGLIHPFGHSGGNDVHQVISITSEEADFSRPLQGADFSLNQTNIMVCKKNVGILKNILIWLHNSLPITEKKHVLPLLIIDDEADNASLNNEGHKGEKYASKINGHIRAILGFFYKKAYLGYTATPFANVIQDRNNPSNDSWPVLHKFKKNNVKIEEEKQFEQVGNLFPDDFITLLDSPTNYIGAHRIFATLHECKKLPVVFSIEDHIKEFPSRVLKESGEGVERFDSKAEWEERVGKFGVYSIFNTWNEYKKGTRATKPMDFFPNQLPESLKDAIVCFILGIAVRDSRLSTMINSKMNQPHNTMLIHISRFTSWQNTTSTKIKEYYETLQTQLKMDKPKSIGSIYDTFEKAWGKYWAHIIGSINKYLPEDYRDDFMQPITFEALMPRLPEAVKGIDILALNSQTREKIDYSSQTPKKIIAIGGNRLSRGFTLEGLTISYFVRTTNFSDSLLQMGRWFGYRLGYVDCCKIFTTKDLIEKYNSTSLCIEELKDEFKRMEEKGASPRDFELRVRKYPGVLKITRSTILKNSILEKWSFQDTLQMTSTFNVSKDKISDVWADFKSNVSPIFKNAELKGSLLSVQVSAFDIINILNTNNNFTTADCDKFKQYIQKCQENNLLTKWTLAIKLTGNAKESEGIGSLEPCTTGLPRNVKLAVRRGPERIEGCQFYQDFIQDQKFRATGSSANIMTSALDMKIAIDDELSTLAEKEFIKSKIKELMQKDSSLTFEEASTFARKKTKPERIYRERLTPDQGVMIIYLFDPYYVFRQEKDKEHDPDIKKMLDSSNQSLNEPIVGLTIGFPPIASNIDPCGEYVKGDYELDSLVDEEEDLDGQLPDDVEVL